MVLILQRPIVAFSIENRVVVNAKKRRIAKSRKNNPLCAEYVKPVEQQKEPPTKKRKNDQEDGGSFSGVQSKF